MRTLSRSDDSAAAPPPRTSLRADLPTRAGVQERRNLSGISRDGLLTTGGAAVSAVCLTLLFFGRLAPLSGRLGFVSLAFVFFIATYAFLISLTDRTTAVVDRAMTALLAACAALAIFALGSVIVYTLYEGAGALTKTNLYTEDMSLTLPNDPVTVGGIFHAIVGTLIQIAMSVTLTVPLGITCAVFLNETDNRITGFVRTVATAMTALPSIVAGLFIFVLWIKTLGYPRSGLAASLALSIMMLPIIIRSADVVLRLVPGNLREAAAALGAPQWRTVWHVVLPTARSGLATAVILGVARGVGETAPVLLTAGFTAETNTNPLENAMVSLPLVTFVFRRAGTQELATRAFAAAAVLMLVVLVLFALARFAGGRPAGSQTKRQRQRAARRSARDLVRIEGGGA